MPVHETAVGCLNATTYVLWSWLFSGFAALAQGWVLMIALTIIHRHWIPAVPTTGYWWAVLITWAFSIMWPRPAVQVKS